jgi:hypothetical protein
VHIRSDKTPVEEAVKMIVSYLEKEGLLTPPAELKE